MSAWGKPFYHAWLTGAGMAGLGMLAVFILDLLEDKHKNKKALRLLAQPKRANKKLLIFIVPQGVQKDE